MRKTHKQYRKPAGHRGVPALNPQKKPSLDWDNIPKTERLQKFMARRGIASRRKCEDMILEGLVQVNRETVTDLGRKIDPKKDQISIGGKPLPSKLPFRYIAMNKPAGYITACEDDESRNIIVDLMPHSLIAEGVVPAGRLDKNTEGLILFSNDGEMIFRLTHPRFSVWKTYRVRVKRRITPAASSSLRKGISIDGGLTSPAKLRILKRTEGFSVLDLTIHEGRKHQVKNMCKAVGHPVLSILRTRIGPVSLGNLRTGEFRNLTASEISALKKEVGL